MAFRMTLGLVGAAVLALMSGGSIVLAGPAAAVGRHPGRADVIVFVSDRDSPVGGDVNDDVYAVEPGTGAVHRLTDDPATESYPAVSNDGRTLLFLSDRAGPDFPNPNRVFEAYTCRLVRTAGAISCPDPQQRTRDVSGVGNLAWTPDGRSIVYAAYASPGSGIYSLSLRAGSRPHLIFSDVAFVGQPAVSPNGRDVAFNWANDVYRVGLDGRRLTPLATGPAIEAGPEYSPDGRTLVLHSNRDGDFDLYTMRPRPESAANPLVNLNDGPLSPQNQRFGSWSPDGRRIAYWWHPTLPGFDDGEIFVMNADGSGPENLTDNNDSSPAGARFGDILPDWGGDAR